ncbi:2-hydroxy-acid oxidase [Wenjunlia vitaminophila]|uniref:2-hydroxy-acid oxidase n=1 Tax=Wenjunlia vitaminophila TaxID=76728 RepID=A0A0T6LWP8_WENVI|nr:alpha-hydroxy acid oxidase [Wenjunlia vitaminophila]KRV50477.1 2-hydroxy-acid oxidase [Wenjunlia vitaminophila]
MTPDAAAVTPSPPVPDAVGRALRLDDLADAARRALPRDVWDFVSGGSGTESALAGNRAAFDRLRAVPRVLAGQPEGPGAWDLVGVRARLPLAIAPMAYQRMLHPRGELATAGAAAAAGVPFTISTLSSQRIEDITALGGTPWFQLYWLRDRGLVHDLVQRAEDSGCRALMVTVDVPRMGRRLRDIRNDFALPVGVSAVNLSPEVARGPQDRRAGASAVADHTSSAFDPTLSWDDLARLRERTRLPLILKGVLHPDDADRAADLGVAALVVSNHGGRQFDGAVASVDALPAVRDAVAGRCALLLDSGVRHGTDVLKALALGASGVLIGRPALWGLAAGGQEGVRTALSLLDEELREAMALSGCADPSAVRRLRLVNGPCHTPDAPPRARWEPISSPVRPEGGASTEEPR